MSSSILPTYYTQYIKNDIEQGDISVINYSKIIYPKIIYPKIIYPVQKWDIENQIKFI